MGSAAGEVDGVSVGVSVGVVVGVTMGVVMRIAVGAAQSKAHADAEISPVIMGHIVLGTVYSDVATTIILGVIAPTLVGKSAANILVIMAQVLSTITSAHKHT